MRQISILALLALFLLVIYQITNPFQYELARKNLALSALSPAQRNNIRLSAEHLNNYVLLPGKEFSFNTIVGPREASRGYKQAPSYMENDSANTMGGGICALSSLLYQMALENDLSVTERSPHTRPVHTVPPGQDATVWYGQADLKFKNPYKEAIQIRCQSTSNHLSVSFYSTPSMQAMTKSQIRSRIIGRSPAKLNVAVEKLTANGAVLLHFDHYSLN